MLENLAPREPKHSSKIDDIRSGLSPEDQKLFDEYLHDVDRWSPNGLALALRAQGIMLSGDTIRRFRQRRGLC
jgi:hypothetical protein